MDNKDKIHYSDGDIALLTDINDLSEFNGIKSDSYLFLACRKGRLQIDINGNTHTIKEGERLTVLPRNFIDNILVSVDADIVMLRLSGRIVSDLMREHIDKWNRMIYIYMQGLPYVNGNESGGSDAILLPFDPVQDNESLAGLS